MKHKLASSLLVAALLGGASSSSAQVLENFSSFQSPGTLFYGDWSNTGDPFSGSPTPIGTFSQGVGFYNLASGTNADSAYVERAFPSSVNLGANDLLTLSLRLLADNTADSLTVLLFDTDANSAFATFQASDFNTAGFTTRSTAFTTFGTFDVTTVTAFRISGNDPFASATLSVALDNLAVTASRVTTPVPESSTYGALAALALFGLVGFHRLRRRV